MHIATLPFRKVVLVYFPTVSLLVTILVHLSYHYGFINQSAEYFCFVTCFFYLDVCLFRKFNNFTKLCFSVFYLLFLLNTLTTFHLYIYSFILRIFPNLSLNIFPVPQEFFSSSLGTPIIHILDFWGFSSKAVNFPVIALFLHSFPCVIGSSFLSAPLIWQWLT